MLSIQTQICRAPSSKVPWCNKPALVYAAPDLLWSMQLHVQICFGPCSSTFTPPHTRYLESLTAANSVSFDLIVSCSSCWGQSLINTLKLKTSKIWVLRMFLLSSGDWCYFYYFMRHNQVASLGALFAQIFLDLGSRCVKSTLSMGWALDQSELICLFRV